MWALRPLATGERPSEKRKSIEDLMPPSESEDDEDDEDEEEYEQLISHGMAHVVVTQEEIS
jgi:hypothetical protein